MSSDGQSQYAIIAGFGLPGRSAAEVLAAQSIPYAVIELNDEVVRRCEAVGLHMFYGDVRDEAVLRTAGIDRATLFVLAVPNDQVIIESLPIIRRLNSTMRIIARCGMTSTGMEALKIGADETVVAEQAVAREMAHAITSPRTHSAQTMAHRPI